MIKDTKSDTRQNEGSGVSCRRCQVARLRRQAHPEFPAADIVVPTSWVGTCHSRAAVNGC